MSDTTKAASAKNRIAKAPEPTAPVAARPARKRAGAATRPAAAVEAPAVEPAPTEAPSVAQARPGKVKKAKLARDSFTMPEAEYAAIASLKKRCLSQGVAARKSEILRAAVATLAGLSDADVLAAIQRLEVIKTGRPAKGGK